MDRNNRPSGRVKKVSTNKASVGRRGTGISHKTGGSVGGSTGFKNRVNPSSRPSQQPSFSQSTIRPRFSFKTMIFIAIALFVLYRFFAGSGDGGLQLSNLVPDAPATNLNNEVGYSSTNLAVLDKSVDPLARQKRTQLLGQGDDQVTLMVYMIGTDLESKSGMATADLNEIMAADISDQLNIIVQTGGTKKWQNNVISSSTNQRYRLTSEGLEVLDQDLGKESMVKPETLSDFIQFGRKNYPANRYMLVLWDHGGGSLAGYGYDEQFPGDQMTLDEIAKALKNGETEFDLIGFDACLMATLETALVLEPYSDYMIASEETEPGIGWYYTDWVTTLSKNPSLPTIDLGKIIIDTYVEEVEQKASRSQATLSIVDLAELKGTLPEALEDFSIATKTLIENNDYKKVSDARSSVKEFSKSANLNQIDLVDFTRIMGTQESNRLSQVIEGAVKYNRTSSNIGHANGLSIYFPYKSLNKVGDMVDTYEDIGMDEGYTDCIKSFASLVSGGQIIAQSQDGGGLLGTLLGQSNNSSSGLGSNLIQQVISGAISGGGFSSLLGGNIGWLDQNLLQQSTTTDYYNENQFDPSALVVTTKDGQKVLALSEKQWSLVQYMEQNVFIDDGEGYIDLGLDNVYEWNEDGDLILDYDGTWMAINGHVVSYYLVSDDHDGDRYTILGRVPALLNGQRVNIILSFTDKEPYGKVLGAQTNYNQQSETNTIAKGLLTINSGDQIDYLCDYYTYDGDYTDSYYLGEVYTATGDWTIENLDISDYAYKMAYRITDIYNHKWWTPTVE